MLLRPCPPPVSPPPPYPPTPTPTPTSLASLQAGAFGGIPGGGLRFGSSHNAAMLVPTASMIDFYNGSGVDVACLGMAEARGCVRVCLVCV